MTSQMRVSICVPPPHERHVAQISWDTVESITEGDESTTDIWAEVTSDGDVLIYPPDGGEPRRFPLGSVMDALVEGHRRLSEIYPDLESLSGGQS